MTSTELRQRGRERFFEGIVIVTSDLTHTVLKLRKIYGLPFSETLCKMWNLEQNGKVVSYKEKQASAFMNEMELQVVEPVEGCTLYAEYLKHYGPGICCVRERIQENMWEHTLSEYEKRGIAIAQREEYEGRQRAWLDLTEEAGILFELVSGRERYIPKEYQTDRALCQINLTVKDVNRTVAFLCEALQIGPWEIGTLNPKTVTDPALLVDDNMESPDFEFKLAITLCGNLEFEVIQPVKGPTVYADFVNRRQNGFNHIKERISHRDWNKVMQAYDEMGVKRAIQGKIGPCKWVYLNTESEFHFLVEIGDDVPMDQLPKGYNPYYYPADEKEG